jgi:hypothetical protein
MRSVMYKRYEYTSARVGDENTVHTGSLLTFVHDIPYFDACGVFPPLHVANQIFSRGQAGGGMSPGTEWKPFTISEHEYEMLVQAVKLTPISEIKPHARYAFLPLKFDHTFDDISDWRDWLVAVCKKHRNEWQCGTKKGPADMKVCRSARRK